MKDFRIIAHKQLTYNYISFSFHIQLRYTQKMKILRIQKKREGDYIHERIENKIKNQTTNFYIVQD